MAIKQLLGKWATAFFSFCERHIDAVVLFRIAFGIMMALAIVRFWLNGWIGQLYVNPSFFFTYYGFEWIKPLGQVGMYTVYALLFVGAIFIAAGFLYRLASILFFVLFTYVELIDKATYLNHYYFISLVALLLCFIPAHKKFSLDVKFGITKEVQHFPRWAVLSLQLQMAVVYFFAGIAKINHDWLVEALPLKIWLPAKNNLPFIGTWLSEVWVAYVFSWCGMLFDTLIPFLLFWNRTKYYAYVVVIIFHTLTAILFPAIGMFPFIMMACATVFIVPDKVVHNKHGAPFSLRSWLGFAVSPIGKLGTAIFLFFFLLQALLPFRYTLYPENLFWHEQGFRFSWRVMLMEKAGMATFYVKGKASQTGAVSMVEIKNTNYLTPLQEKQMSTQPDMILQFAHHLAQVYKLQGWESTEVYVESYVSLNGKGSCMFIDPNVNLASLHESFARKHWIFPYKKVPYKLAEAL